MTTRADARRILVLVNRLPYPVDDGWKVRVNHVLRAATRAAPTDLVAFCGESPDHARALAASFDGRLTVHEAPEPRFRRPIALLRGLLTRESYHSASQASGAYAETVRAIARETPPSVAIAEGFHYGRYLRLLPDARKVIDTHNVDSTNVARYAQQLGGLERLYALQTVPKLRRIEQTSLRFADELWMCSEQDAQLMDAPPDLASRLVVIPNGVDTNVFRPSDVPKAEREFVFFGRLDYFPNVDAVAHLVQDVLPHLPASVDLKVRVVGSGDSSAVRRLLGSDPRVTFVGRVDDIRAEVARAVASIVPLRAGGGTRLKLLESLSLGTPAITTSIGAEGLLPDIAGGIWLADTPADFAERMRQVASDPTAARERGAAGRRLVEERFDWTALTAQMTERLAPLADR